MNEPLEIDLFWSFRSPWSYLATGRLKDWQDKYRLRINFRAVYPIAIRTPEFFQQANPLWAPYLFIDVYRVAEFLDIPFAWPEPDPVNQYVDEGGIRRTDEDQPHIHRLTRLGVVAEEKGRGIQFADQVSALIWGGTVDWHRGRHLEQATTRAGLDLAQMDQIIDRETDRIEAVIEANQVAHEKVGHWGVPTCAFEGEPFFGQDRLDVLLWRLKKEGLQER